MKIQSRIFVGMIFIFISSALFAEEGFNYDRYSFLASGRWEGKKIYHHKDNIFEIKPFIRKGGSRLFKIRREGINYYIEEIHDGIKYFPDVDGYEGNKILELSRDIFKYENRIEFPDGEEILTTPTMYRVFNGNYKKDTDPLYGDWTFKSSPDEYHEYKTVRGDFQFLIYIPDYDEASRYNEEGWHYLRYVKENEFETDSSFPDARFRLIVKSDRELVLIPQFMKHDKTDGIVYLHPVE